MAARPARQRKSLNIRTLCIIAFMKRAKLKSFFRQQKYFAEPQNFSLHFCAAVLFLKHDRERNPNPNPHRKT